MSNIDEMRASVRRAQERASIACILATQRFATNDDVEVVGRPLEPDSPIYVHTEDGVAEYVDGGYWVEARIFVDADDVETHMQDPDWKGRYLPA